MEDRDDPYVQSSGRNKLSRTMRCFGFVNEITPKMARATRSHMSFNNNNNTHPNTTCNHLGLSGVEEGGWMDGDGWCVCLHLRMACILSVGPLAPRSGPNANVGSFRKQASPGSQCPGKHVMWNNTTTLSPDDWHVSTASLSALINT